MFRGLIASAPSGGVGGGFGRGGVLSVILHGVVIYAAVVATNQPPPSTPTRRIDTTVFVFDRGAEEHIPEQTESWPTGLAIPAPALPTPVLPALPMAPDPPPYAAGGIPSDSALRILGLQLPGDRTNVYAESGVDEKPALLTTAPLEYPALLRQAGVEGSVTIELVVDTSGHAESNSVRVVMSSNRAFEAPARTAVVRSLFRPGRVRGQLVRVLVQVPVTFAIRR